MILGRFTKGLLGTKRKSSSSEQMPYSFLSGSMQICMVDDDPIILNAYAKVLHSYPLYTITTSTSATSANAIFSSNRRFHVCIMDLGLVDIDNNEFYLINKFSPRISFIVLTGNNSIQRGFQCGKQGSFSVFSKPVDFSGIEFITKINEAFLMSLLNSGNNKKYKPILNKIIDALLVCNPENIGEWAYNACVTEQYLRRIWNTIYGCQPKYFLWFYRIMISAFSLHNAEFLKNNGLSTKIDGTKAIVIEKKVFPALKYFKSNKNVFKAILNSYTAQ
jgi:CheY-like chemotaxis protein